MPPPLLHYFLFFVQLFVYIDPENMDNRPGRNTERPNSRAAGRKSKQNSGRNSGQEFSVKNLGKILGKNLANHLGKTLGETLAKNLGKTLGKTLLEKTKWPQKIENSAYFSPAACACQNKFFSRPALLTGCPPPCRLLLVFRTAIRVHRP